MADLDFDGLRGDVEAATKVPDFEAVERRGRRARRRDRVGAAAAVAATLAVLVPVGVIALKARPAGAPEALDPSPGPIGLSPDGPSPSSGPPAATVHAVAGLQLDSLYAAVDVCQPTKPTPICSLQVVPLGLTAAQQRGPIAVGELRAADTDPLDDVQLQTLSPRWLLLSGIGPDGQRAYRRINVSGGATAVEPEATDSAGPRRGDRLVQLRLGGEAYYVQQTDDRVYRLRGAPTLDRADVITGLSPDSGWWITGVLPGTDELAVAVSRDQGATWLVRGLGVGSGIDRPIVATRDGVTGYVFVRTAQGIQQRRTSDGGQSWEPVTASMPWPELSGGGDAVTRRFGAAVRQDGTLLVWLEEAPAAVYLESADRGATFHPTSGPAGRVVAVSDGYVAVSDPPLISLDGRTWTAIPGPAYLPPN